MIQDNGTRGADGTLSAVVRRWRKAAHQYLPKLLGATLIEWIGTGLFTAVSAIYFVRVVGLSESSVGIGMMLAGVVAMLTAVPVGALADRWGVRRSLIAITLWRAAAVAAYAVVTNWWIFFVVTAAVVVGEQAVYPLTQALVGERTPESRRTKVMAAHRAVLNIGMSVGGLAAAIPLAIGTLNAFRWLFLAMAVLFVVSAGLIALLPDTRVAGRPATWRLSALRDRRLLALTTYDSIAALWLPMLNVAFPLWLTGRTGAPDALVGVLYAVNTATCVLLQIPMSRFVNGPRDALRAYTVNATLLMVSCVGFALAPLLGGWPTLILLSAAILVLTIGELFQVNAAWTLSYAIAPEQRRTEYLATFSLGRTSSARLYGPVLMTGGVLALGSTGWLLLAVLLAAAALAPAVVRHRLPRPATP